VLALPAAAGPVDWAHQNGSVQSNGAVTVKSLSGGSYSATGNPSGAVAKANQNAATQPPTVIIQATSSANAEMVPLVVTGSSVIPSCPSGYTSVFSKSGTGTGAMPPVFNVAGSKFTFGYLYYQGSYYVGFTVDTVPVMGYSSGTTQLYYPPASITSGTQWAAALCSK